MTPGDAAAKAREIEERDGCCVGDHHRLLVEHIATALIAAAADTREEVANNCGDLILAAVQAEREACAKVVPSNWIDSMLTGPDGIGRGPYDERTIEKLLRKIAAAIRARGKK